MSKQQSTVSGAGGAGRSPASRHSEVFKRDAGDCARQGEQRRRVNRRFSWTCEIYQNLGGLTLGLLSHAVDPSLSFLQVIIPKMPVNPLDHQGRGSGHAGHRAAHRNDDQSTTRQEGLSPPGKTARSQAALAQAPQRRGRPAPPDADFAAGQRALPRASGDARNDRPAERPRIR